MYYYISGLSLEDTIRMTDRSRRQIMRYKGNRGEEGERRRWDGWHLKGTGMTPKWHPNVILRFKRGYDMISSAKEEKKFAAGKA